MNKIYTTLPFFLQNLMISIYNYLSYKKRYGGKYNYFRQLYKRNDKLSLEELKIIQFNKLKEFLNFSKNHSPFYNKKLKSIDLDGFCSIEDIKLIPLTHKEELRQNLDLIYTISKDNGIESKTGGTTGKSLNVYFTSEDMQDRFAMLDNFRSKFGYELGKKTAWFSGKNLLKQSDLKKKRFWRNDFLYKVRYYSTFHIKEEYLEYYVKDLVQFKPEYLVGFPSTMLEIARKGLKMGLKFEPNQIKAIFPTAEMITQEMRDVFSEFFNSFTFDQYASSEGAPFIFECENNKLHLELQSGVFEVLDDSNNNSNNGRLVITSFTTHGTPLIRYEIGDSVELSNTVCGCENNNPVVDKIHGRIDDYVFSSENGKINLGNISNTLKDTIGIKKFQVIQNEMDKILILMIVENEVYTEKIEQIFLMNWRDRVGNMMKIEINYVDKIDSEYSGKFRLIKNNIKHLLNN